MNKNLCSRVKEEAKYLISTKKTIREVAEYFHLSKSTIHKDIQERLPFLSSSLYQKVRIILDEHLEERHIRGGETTKQKYLNKQVSWSYEKNS